VALLLLFCRTNAASAKIPKDVVAHVACDVCGHAMREVFNISKEQGATNEDDIAGIVDRLCSIRGTSTWMLQLDIIRPVSNGPLRLKKHEEPGRCRKECSIVQRACSVSLDGQEENLVRRLQDGETSALELEKGICQHACKAKLPALSNWKDEAFEAKRGLDADELAEYKHKLGIEGEVNSFGSGSGTGQLDMESVPDATKRAVQDAMGKQDKSVGDSVSMDEVPEDIQQKLKSAMSGAHSSSGFDGLFGGMQKNKLDTNALSDSVKQSVTEALEGPAVGVTVSISDDDLLDLAIKPPVHPWDGNLLIHFRTLNSLETLFEAYCKHVGLEREGVSFSFRAHGVLSGEKSLSDYGIGANDVIHASIAMASSVDAEEEPNFDEEEL